MAPHPDIIRLPDRKDMPTDSTSLLRWILFFIAPYKGTVYAYLVYRVFYFTAFGLIPLFIGFAINGLESGDAFERPVFYSCVVIGYLLFCTILSGNVWVFHFEMCTHEKISRALTLLSMQHVTSLPLTWHEQQGSGGKMQRIMTARKGFIELAIIFRWTIMPITGSLFGVIISIITLDAPLYYLLIYALFFASYVFVSLYFGRSVPELYNRFNQKFESLLSGVYEFASAIRTVKSFGLQRYMNHQAMDLETQGQNAIANVYSKIFRRWCFLHMTGFFWTTLLVGLGFWGTVQGWHSVGVFAAVYFLAENMWRDLERVSEVQEKIYEHSNGLKRLIDTLRIQPTPLDIRPVQDVPENWQSITFDSLSFAYDGQAEQGVRDLSFTVRKGEKVAFVGESGAGKSTLVKLLMKQMLPDSGAIQVGGTDLKHIASQDWLDRLGFVPQDVELFNLSIRDNILIDRQDIDEVQYREALRQAALDEFINSLPEKDDTMIGERGIKLSGGQRQRLGIARALVRGADVIIFDEATSSLDSLSEQKIQQAMENSFHGRTAILIAHRLSTVRHVDTIIVLEKGQMIEQGCFEDLIGQNGRFAELWRVQSGSV